MDPRLAAKKTAAQAPHYSTGMLRLVKRHGDAAGRIATRIGVKRIERVKYNLENPGMCKRMLRLTATDFEAAVRLCERLERDRAARPPRTRAFARPPRRRAAHRVRRVVAAEVSGDSGDPEPAPAPRASARWDESDVARADTGAPGGGAP